VPYLDNVWRSFRISWNHKYLWLIALFAGEGGSAGFNSSTGTGASPPGRGGETTGPPDLGALQTQVTAWITEHAGLIVFLVVLWLVLVIAFFILAAICEGATVRSSAEHDADRPWGLGVAWRAGVHTMWAVVRFRLLLILLGLPLLILVVAFVVGVVIAIVNQNGSAALPLILSGFLLVLISIPYGIYLHFLDRLGSRALVLEQLGARASIVRAHRLLFKRLGRSLLVWLLSLAVGIVVGIVAGVAFAIVLIPLFIAGAFAYANNSAALIAIIALGVVIYLPISLVVGGFLSAQSSTYWTLAFRRLDLDYPPA
jgi:hypothetical protein